MKGRLREIEGKPAMAMTPEVYRDRIEEMGRLAGGTAGQAMSERAAAQSQAKRELKEMLGRARSKRGQRRWLVGVGIFHVVFGIALWMLLIPRLPWGAGTRLAAVPIAGNKWHAGQELLREARPAARGEIITLYNTRGEQAVASCQ